MQYSPHTDLLDISQGTGDTLTSAGQQVNVTTHFIADLFSCARFGLIKFLVLFCFFYPAAASVLNFLLFS